MIPLQFLHSLRLSFLGITISIPVLHSLGISSLSQISFSRLYKTSAVAPISAFKTSDGVLSIPGALSSVFQWTSFIERYWLIKGTCLRPPDNSFMQNDNTSPVYIEIGQIITFNVLMSRKFGIHHQTRYIT